MKKLFRCTLCDGQEGPGIVLLKAAVNKSAAVKAAKRHWGRYGNGQWPMVLAQEIAEVDGYTVTLQKKGGG